MQIKNLLGAQTILKPMCLDFVTERYLGWLNDDEITRFLTTSNYTMTALREYVLERLSNPDVMFWAIFSEDGGAHIGNVKLEPIEWGKGTATFGILIGDRNFWGKGIATEVTRVVSDFALKELKLNRVKLGVQIENQAAIRAYEKAGFQIIPGKAPGKSDVVFMVRDQPLVDGEKA